MPSDLPIRGILFQREWWLMSAGGMPADASFCQLRTKNSLYSILQSRNSYQAVDISITLEDPQSSSIIVISLEPRKIRGKNGLT
jgi:hypothetical protein